MGELMALLVTSVLVNNVILTQFLGMCPFMGVSKKKSSAIGMGVAVVFVIVVAALVTYALYYLVLVPLQLYQKVIPHLMLHSYMGVQSLLLLFFHLLP